MKVKQNEALDMILAFVLGMVLLVITPNSVFAKNDSVILVSKANPVSTIVVAKDAPELTRSAAENLAYYIHEISGAKLSIVTDPRFAKTPALIWVGPHPELTQRHTDVDIAFTGPEETLVKISGGDLILIGQDILAEDGVQLQAGTNLAVSSFIEDQLGVRWLWPGKWGTDIPKKATVRIKPISSRYIPPLRVRSLNLPNYERSFHEELGNASKKILSKYVKDPLAWTKQKDIEARRWLNLHRSDARSTGSGFIYPLAGSWSAYRTATSHGFKGWYAKYGKTKPEWFALQADGTRQEGEKNPYPNAADVKMCVSNPEVAEQWLKDAEAYFRERPHATVFNAGERDFGWQGYCLCQGCLAMDNKEAETLEANIRWENESRPFYALTDRYAKFWNILAKRLKEKFPDREVYVGVSAYHVTRPAPSIRLDDHIIPIFIGIERRFYQNNSQKETLDQRRMWLGWWEAVGKQRALIWRPNILYRTLGLPYIFTKRHGENMRFLADHGLAGTSFAAGGNNWAVHGPQLYLMAKLNWNPWGDTNDILADYYQRAFGPGANYIKEYYQLFENLYARLAEQYQGQPYSTYSDPPRLFREIRQDDQKATARLGSEGVPRNTLIEDKAADLLESAADAVAGADKIYRQRVAFVKAGFDLIQAQLDCIEAINDFSDDPSDKNRKRAVVASAKRELILGSNMDGSAVNIIDILADIERQPSRLGPPKENEQKKSDDEETIQQDLGA